VIQNTATFLSQSSTKSSYRQKQISFQMLLNCTDYSVTFPDQTIPLNLNHVMTWWLHSVIIANK